MDISQIRADLRREEKHLTFFKCSSTAAAVSAVGCQILSISCFAIIGKDFFMETVNRLNVWALNTLRNFRSEISATRFFYHAMLRADRHLTYLNYLYGPNKMPIFLLSLELEALSIVLVPLTVQIHFKFTQPSEQVIKNLTYRLPPEESECPDNDT